MNKIQHIIALCILSIMLSSFCCKEEGGAPCATTQGKSIVVLYENDVHCGMDGYTKMAGLRNAINESDTAECIIVSSGDFLQGGNWGSLSQGGYIVDVMNAMGYSAVTIGNHEFDYGIPRMMELLQPEDSAAAKRGVMPVTCVNFGKTSTMEQCFKPYIMTTVAGKRLAFVGVVTPTTMQTEYYAFSDKDSTMSYNLYPDLFCQLTQKAVDEARSAGADYVFILSHLGEDEKGFSSIDLIKATDGFDLLLDGHTHSVIPDSSAVNKDGKVIHFTQTGTKFENIGKLTISQTGALHTELLPASSITYADSSVNAVIDSIAPLVRAITDEKVGTSNHVLSMEESPGQRDVRRTECTAGDFVADALRYCMNTDIGLVNGGGVRVNLPAGDITYGDIINVSPFFNDMEAREMTGATLRRYLTECYSLLPEENGEFMQVSGLKVTIDITHGTPVITGMQVLDKASGCYVPLDDNATYTVGSSNYCFGHSKIVADCKIITPVIIKDTEAIKKYLVKCLHGDIGNRYLTTEGRITILR